MNKPQKLIGVKLNKKKSRLYGGYFFYKRKAALFERLILINEVF
jgi:hypothetical protein